MTGSNLSGRAKIKPERMEREAVNVKKTAIIASGVLSRTDILCTIDRVGELRVRMFCPPSMAARENLKQSKSEKFFLKAA